MTTTEKQGFVKSVLNQNQNANIHLTIHRVAGEKKAKGIVEAISQQTGIPYEHKYKDGFNWYSIEGEGVSVSVFYQYAPQEDYMIEDVSLTIEEGEVN